MSWNGIERRKSNIGFNLDKLIELTDNLPSFEEYDGNYGVYKEWKIEGGVAFSWTLFRKGNELLVQRWFMSKGGMFPTHTHQGKQVSFVYEGSIEVTINGEKKVYRKGDVFEISPGAPHSLFCPEADVKSINISAFPIEMGYINGQFMERMV